MYRLVVGNKRYSSWSLRGFLALARTGAPFDEVVVPLDRPETRAELLAHSPSGRVPVLRHKELFVWDSLAIGELLAERHPEAHLWPKEADARAVARAAVAEMHAGFAALRTWLPMDLVEPVRGRGPHGPGAAADIDRVTALWRDLRARFGGDGDFLFGPFTLADCFYAPVAARFRVYRVELDPVCSAYVDAIHAWPDFRRWEEDARAEPWVIESP